MSIPTETIQYSNFIKDGHGYGVEREKMIAIAAYHIAENRGFIGGDPIDDWLVTEAEIDVELSHPD